MPSQTCSRKPSSRFTKRSRWMRIGAFALACSFGSLLLWSDTSTADGTRDNRGFNRVTGSSVEPAQYVPGEVIVKFLDSASKATVAAAGGQMIKSFAGGGGRVQHVKLNKGETVEAALERFRHSPAVEYAEPNYIHHVAAIPNDTLFTSLWGLRNTGQNVRGTVGTADVDIDAPEAWDITTGSSNVIIGVIDTGIAYDHPDLAANIWKNPGEIPNDGIDNDGNGLVDDVFGYDFHDDDSEPIDPNGHGTHVAGTIGAVGNNNSGVTGVMQKVKLMALKAGDENGDLPDVAILQAIDYAIRKRIRVINASFIRTGKCNKAEYDALSEANAAGVMVLAAAGNDNSDSDKNPVFPAGYSVTTEPDCGPALPNVISVAAINQTGDKASFSNFGASSVQIAAPGVDINSTNPGTPNAPNDYQFRAGTSMAAPHVTGVVGLLLSVNPNLTVAQIRNAILNTGDVSSQLKDKVSSGRRLNAFNALNSIAPTFTVMVAKNGTGTGTVASTPAGINCGGDCNARFPGGTTVTLTATPGAGSVFTGWSGGGCTGAGTCVVSTTATITANFNLPAPSPFTVTVSKNGTGAGTVASSPAGITCGAACTATYPGGTRVTLTATADAGSVFTGWSGGGCAGAGTCVVPTTNTVTATFTVIPPQQITVTVNKDGTGSGTVTSSPAGIDCGGDCTGTYPGGTTVTLTPKPTAESVFAGWSGGCTGTDPCHVTSTATVMAIFNLLPLPGTFTVTVVKEGTGTGKVVSTPTLIDCGAKCIADFLNNTNVTLTATADGGATFTGWSGAGCTGTGSCVVSTAATATATFDAPAGASNASTPAAGGGGCTLAQAGTNDALMPIILLMTIGALIWRSRRRL